ncbi:MAG TPA: amino acid adenylation domain-containing protein [Streptosporangiaceae bacterium]|nr:amino acid adenylation domain-containing protein [Streptosporangiaceae bacterium]
MRMPVSFSQQRVWFLEQLMPGHPTYHMPYAMWLEGPLDADALQRALDALVARHAVLRTTIAAFDGVPEQVIADTFALPIERIELDAGTDDERTEQAEAIAAERARKPFDLAERPPIRIALITAGPGRHLLSLVMHHGMSDGESLRIMMEEWSALYVAETTGEPAKLPQLWMTYGDYAVWQQERLRGEELERQLSWWREHLRGAPTVINLPADRPRPARGLTPDGQVAVRRIDLQTTRRLASLAHGVNATLFMLFLTGFAATMSRYARQSDLVIGTQVAGRTHIELDPMLGMFTNTVVLRVLLTDDPTFTTLLKRVRDTTIDAMSHQQLPFEKLIEDIDPDRSLTHLPLTHVQFAYGSLTPPALDLPGVTARNRALFTGTAKLDLTMYADHPEGEPAAFVLEYSKEMFDHAWAERFLRCMTRLLASAADAPDTPVADLPMVPADELDELIIERNRRPGASASGVDVLSLLRASKSSVTDGSGPLPMRVVRDRAARIAGVLAGRGVSAETRVGLCAGRGIGMLAGLLGVWWAGGAYVPLDPGFPEARLAAMARGAGLQIIVSDSAHRDLARSIAADADVICVDDPQTLAASPLEPAAAPASALAYVIFTSGSTGQPKGVGIEHRAVANLLASFRRALELGPGEVFVAVTTLSFDIALLELLLPLICGADLVIATADETREPDRLRSLIERTGATAMQATPASWRMLIEAGGVPDNLRLRLCGGEALPADLADHLMAPGITLWNVYGPTETTVWSAAGVVTSAGEASRIGPPIDHTRVYVLDDRMMPVPIGVVGEVCLAGRGVARGYHDRPLLTARSFRPDPWSDEPGARLYRTGDLGRWRADGGLELIGRTDHQVKVRGFRIECGEIEAVLRAHRDVRQAAVVTADRAGEPALVAYIVPRRSSAAARPETDLLEEFLPHLKTRLPDYMIPALVVALPALPLTPNAKVDRAALPAPQWGAQAPSADLAEPRNPVEAAFAKMWAGLLATEAPIGIHDNLFALGGHSLTATRFVARVADVYGVNLPVHEVFAGPTIAELAAFVSADPNFGLAGTSPKHAELDDLSDEALDELLRAALAQRSRRQAQS